MGSSNPPLPFEKGEGLGWGFPQPGVYPQAPLPFLKGEGLGVGFETSKV